MFYLKCEDCGNACKDWQFPDTYKLEITELIKHSTCLSMLADITASLFVNLLIGEDFIFPLEWFNRHAYHEVKIIEV